MTLDQTNFLLSILTVIGQVLVLVLFLTFIFRTKINDRITKYINNNALAFAFIVSLVATLGSLYYSEIANFKPCTLCWYQRILMYPQVIILGLALLKKESKIIDYSLALSIIGFFVSVYHNYIYYMATTSGLCGLESCTQKYITGFGYVTIPIMAISGFLLIGVLLLIRRNLHDK